MLQFPSPCGEKVGVTYIPSGSSLTIPKFPSPCGEKVGVTNGITISRYPATRQFPSPCGEKVGVTVIWGGRTMSIDPVSVPLRGKDWGDPITSI